MSEILTTTAPTLDATVTPQTTPPTTTSDIVPPDDLNERINKARTDERNKLRKQIDAIETEKKALIARLDETSKKIQELETKNKEIQDGTLTEQQRDRQRMTTLETENANLVRQMDKLADASAQRVRQLELKLYRDQKIAKLKFPELVSDSLDSEEAIDMAVDQATLREQKIYADVKQEVETSRPKPTPGHPPAPLNPQTRVVSAPVSTPSIKEIRRMTRTDYEATRTQLLDKAKREAGIV